MPRKSLRDAIAHLQGELESGDPLSPEERVRLDRVLGEVASILDADPEGAGAAGSSGAENADSDSESDFVDDLRDFRDGFEESHPELALVLGRIMDSLSQLGI